MKISFSHLFICLWSRDFRQDISQEINTNLPARRVLTEESEFVCEPVIDLMKGQLHLGGFQYCLKINFVCKNNVLLHFSQPSVDTNIMNNDFVHNHATLFPETYFIFVVLLLDLG